MITPKKLRLLHIARKQLGFDEEQWRAILGEFGGVRSARDLADSGFRKIMDYFVRWGFRSDWTKRTFGERLGMATPAQVDLIRDLWREWSGADDDRPLNQWLERSFHVSALRFLTAETATKAINGLRAMNRRRQKVA